MIETLVAVLSQVVAAVVTALVTPSLLRLLRTARGRRARSRR
ncbi:hypothetical protein [Actinokineospora sp. NPDC004072]